MCTMILLDGEELEREKSCWCCLDEEAYSKEISQQALVELGRVVYQRLLKSRRESGNDLGVVQLEMY